MKAQIVVKVTTLNYGGELWTECPSLSRWAHKECAGVDDGVNFLWKYCGSDLTLIKL